jgi:hypothetical protein
MHLPRLLFENCSELQSDLLPNNFAKFFDVKIRNLLYEVQIGKDMYNGNKKVNSVNKMFMTITDTHKCIKTLNSKNAEGFDRISQ